jgi:membrane associated rhomboid family serine protease
MLLETPVTLVLLVVNGLVGFHTLYQDPSLLDRWSFRPYALQHRGEWWRLLTAGFVHVSLAHLAFNMLTLFFFGPTIETILGSAGFVALYFGSEITANVATMLRFANNPAYSAAGASGAVSGVVFSYCLFFPFNLLYLFFAVPIPAILFAVLYVALSIYAAKQGRDNVAHEAHLGGAVGGVLLTILLEPSAIGIFLRQIGF